MKLSYLIKKFSFVLAVCIAGMNAMEDPAYKGTKRLNEDIASSSGNDSSSLIENQSFLPVKRSRIEPRPQTLQSTLEERIDTVIKTPLDKLEKLVEHNSIPLKNLIDILNIIFDKKIIWKKDLNDETTISYPLSLINADFNDYPEITSQNGLPQKFHMPYIAESFSDTVSGYVQETYNEILNNNPKIVSIIAMAIKKLSTITPETVKEYKILVDSLPELVKENLKKQFLLYASKFTLVYDYNLSKDNHCSFFMDPKLSLIVTGHSDGVTIHKPRIGESRKFNLPGPITYTTRQDIMMVVIGDSQGIITLIDLTPNSQAKFRAYRAHTADILNCVSIDGKQISIGKDKTLVVWDTINNQTVHSLPNIQIDHEQTTHSIIPLNQNRIALNEIDAVRIYNIQTGTCELTLDEPLCSKIIAVNDNLIAILSNCQRKVTIWDISNGQTISELSLKNNDELHTINDILKIDDSTIATVSVIDPEDYDDTITIWDSISGKMLHQIIHSNIRAAFLFDKNILGLINDDGYLVVFNILGQLLSARQFLPTMNHLDIAASSEGIRSTTKPYDLSPSSSTSTINCKLWTKTLSLEKVFNFLAQDNKSDIYGLSQMFEPLTELPENPFQHEDKSDDTLSHSSLNDD